jgi:hypothetical protein
MPQSVLALYPDQASQDKTFVVNMNRSSNNVIIQGLKCHDCRARGVQIQSSNYLVQDSEFSYIQQPGLVVRADADTKEGAGVDNALVKGCTFFEVDRNDWKQQGALRSYLVDQMAGNSSTYPVFSNISFIGNRLEQMPRRSFNLHNTRDLTVVGNSVINTQANRPETLERGTVYLEDVDGAKISSNTWNPTSEAKVQSGPNVVGLVNV